ncbi:MAG: alkaline phosphatase family protein [Thermoplasmata archaeon]|nr:alkaline phosphatase family protein [Thermoplasmata archaeon]
MLSAVVLSGIAAGAVTAKTPATATPTTSDCPGLKLPTPICHVYVLFMENENVGSVLAQGRYEASLAKQYAFAAQYYSYKHYSFPNYLIATSGKATNYVHQLSATNLGDLLDAHTPVLSWEAYMQTMPTACDRNSSGSYLSAHNPFVWYNDVYGNQTFCKHHDVAFSSFTRALASENPGLLPTYGLFSPNSTSDCENSSIAHCDAFLKNWLGPLLTKPFFNSTVWFVTYDEGLDNSTLGANGTEGGGHVYTTAVSPYACKNYSSQVNYTDYSLLTTTEWLLGVGHTGYGDNYTSAPPMKELFCFPSSSGGASPSGGLALGPGSLEPALARRLTAAY